MIGLMVLGVFGLYVLVSIIVVTITYRTAKSNGAPEPRVRRAAGVAALVMYLLLFWDWVPTIVAKQYYCRTQGGFYLYKTLDQWKQENPGVAETLTWKLTPDKKDSTYDPATGSQTYVLNHRFLWDLRQRKLPLLPVTLAENRLIDCQTNEVLARQGGVWTGYLNPMVGGGLQGWKGWLNLEPCDGAGHPSEREFNRLTTSAQRLGGQR